MFPRAFIINRNLSVGLALAMTLAATVCAAATTTAPATMPAAPAAPAATTAPATTATAVTVPVPVVSEPGSQVKIKKKAKKLKISATAFVGQINAHDVNVRSGPGLSYYTLGQLGRGDLVKVTGERAGWYRFAAPAGVRCYIARQFVKLSADGTTGTVTGSFVNVRAASALTPGSNYAVVDMLNTGATVSVTGQTPTYDIIRAPKGTGVYVLARFVSPAPAGSTYVTPELKMPAGFKGTGLSTTSTPAAASKNSTVASSSSTGLSAPVAPITSTPAVGSAMVPAPAVPTTTKPAPTAQAPKAVNQSLLPAPAVSFNSNAYSTFTDLNRRMQIQFNKPIMQRNLQPLLAGFENLLKSENVPHFVRHGCIARIKLLKKQIAIQEIVASSHTQKPLTAVLAPYQQQWEQSQRELAKAQAKAPYIAFGTLKTSTVLRYYALMNPVNGRVVAYLEPTAKINISKLLGSYIGVKGEVISRTGVVVRVIKVTSATMFPEPSSAQAAPAAP